MSEHTLNPTSAIVLYGKKDESPCYAMSHQVIPVTKPGDGFKMTEGTPLSVDKLKTTLSSLLCNNQQAGASFIPPNLIAHDPVKQILAWHVDGQTRPYFQSTRSFMAPWPNLFLLAVRKAIFVFALASKGRPTPDTKLFHAPLNNVYENGDICQGNTTRAKGTRIKNIPEWEDVVFNSKFTHPNDHIRRCKKESVEKLWESLEGKKKFPHQQLIPADKTVSELLAEAEMLSSKGY